MVTRRLWGEENLHVSRTPYFELNLSIFSYFFLTFMSINIFVLFTFNIFIPLHLNIFDYLSEVKHLKQGNFLWDF